MTQLSELQQEAKASERAAMNIVYQICDLLETPVDVRQKHNDTMIDFTMGFIQRAYELGVQEAIKAVPEERNSKIVVNYAPDGDPKNEIMFTWSDCRSQTLENLKMLITPEIEKGN